MFVQLKALYACELLHVQNVAKCVAFWANPVLLKVRADFLTFLGGKLGLPPNSFLLPFYHFFNLKSGFALALS